MVRNPVLHWRIGELLKEGKTASEIAPILADEEFLTTRHSPITATEVRRYIWMHEDLYGIIIGQLTPEEKQCRITSVILRQLQKRNTDLDDIAHRLNKSALYPDSDARHPRRAVRWDRDRVLNLIKRDRKLLKMYSDNVWATLQSIRPK